MSFRLKTILITLEYGLQVPLIQFGTPATKKQEKLCQDQ